MCSKNFIKRIVPFFLTFAVGLFIASFFVTIAAPTFRLPFRGGERFRRHKEYHRMIEFENQQLREDKIRLEKQLADKEDFSSLGSDGFGVASHASERKFRK
jgi:hypothetical protein